MTDSSVVMPVEMAQILATEMTNWWEEVNESTQWQDGIFFALCGAYALVSAIALRCYSGNVDDGFGKDDVEDPSSNSGDTINVTHLPHVWYYALFSVVFHPLFSTISTTILRHLNHHSSSSDIELWCTCGHRNLMYMWILNLGGHVNIVL
ncbi:hypothetical protein F2Q68_00013997 [Brassica cretica]|uniref:THH1/TOM1/TOM3 domain-containing protein n=1 Tax=Brassica cretica TaxID=69181 RepID=A0A8S9HJH2_BRACR|nr:hypothetical protein F2Q68_00013997 [Brassica cretica]